MLRGIKVSKYFGTHQVLHDIDIEIRPGTITTIIGPSGSGKSTLLRCLALLDPPTRGAISLEEYSLTYPGNQSVPPGFWPRLSVVFQQLFLWPHLTLAQNALLPLRTLGISDAIERVHEVFRQLEIEKLAARYPNQVSLGQRQLAAIARALALKPRYLLLDEITSALDVEYVAMILRQLRRLKADGVGLLLISHLIDFARSSGDQIVFLDSGQVVEQGSPDILTAPATQRLERFLGLMRDAR